MTFPLSVLDLIPHPRGLTSSQALRNSIDLARHVDRLGYHRHWYAEHHNMPTVVSTTPEIMIAMAAEATERIRVGSGGVMLPNHAPLKVAEAFKMLAALHPGRIDLGIGRAPGTDPGTAVALRGSKEALGAEDFTGQLAELVALGQGSIPSRVSTTTISAIPEDVALPDIWLLGSSDYGARLAAVLGVGFGFAAHFSDLPPERPMLEYRENFASDGPLVKPHAILTLSVVCAETDEEAERLASSQILAFTRLRTGQKPELVSPEEALAYPYNPLERSVVQQVKNLMITGSPETVRPRIESIVARTQADEVMITTGTYDHAARLRSYTLLADAFGLKNAPAENAGTSYSG